MDFHDQLDVFLNEDKIGSLFTDNGVMSFRYEASFLQAPDAYALSRNLPLSDQNFSGSEVESFFCLFDGLFHKNKTLLCLKILSVTQVKTSRP